MRFLSSTTVAWSTTSSTCLRKTKTPLSAESGLWAAFGTAFGAVFGSATCPLEAGRGALLVGGDWEDDCGADCKFAADSELATATAGSWFAWEFARNSVVRRKKNSSGTLFRRRIVTRLGVDPKRRQSFWRLEFHFYFTPFAIAHWILWTVSYDILVAQLDANFCGNVRQVVRVINGKRAATSQFRDIAEQGGSEPLFFSRKVMIVDADGVDENVGLFDHGTDLAFGIAAMVVAAIGDDQQSLLRILRLAHLADAQVNRIQQRRAPLGNRVDEPALNVVHRAGEIGNLLRLIRESNHEELVLRVGGLEELDHRLAGALGLAAHAAAHIKNHPDRNRSVFPGESFDLLLVFAFEKVEVLAVEAGYQPV